ncbi:hypothetical protein HYX13_02545 [Candidatus Woesearchaeota archaeon]|nr:hypothetical protein [Candidatus Woesearchaeota archaeon]
MLVFGIDVPLVEVVLLFLIVTVILLVEVLVLIGLLMKEIHHARRYAQHATKLSETLGRMNQIELKKLKLIKR